MTQKNYLNKDLNLYKNIISYKTSVNYLKVKYKIVGNKQDIINNIFCNLL